MKMISLTVKEDYITEINLVPYDERLFDEHRVKSYEWLSAGVARNNIEYVADHYAADIVDIVLKTECITSALVGAMDVYFKIMNENIEDDDQFHSIKNL